MLISLIVAMDAYTDVGGRQRLEQVVGKLNTVTE